MQQQIVDANECFHQSYQLLAEMGTATADELLLTLTHWAKYKHLRDETSQAEALQKEAAQIAQQYNLSGQLV